MLERLQQVAERYFVASVFVVFGVINAEPWPLILGFIAFGAAIDIWFARAGALSPVDPPSGEQTVGERLRRSRLIPFFIGYLVVAGLIYVLGSVLAINHPAALAAIGPLIFDLASPFIALLRHHYTDLAAHGFAERANFVAVNYAGQFLLFYASLGLWLGKIGYTKAPRTPLLRVRPGQSNKGAISGAFLLLLLVLSTVHFMTWVDIDYGDHYIGRRHINLNLAEYDTFFWKLAFMQDVFVIVLPMLLWFARLVPRAALPPSD